jgi:hypothetical protein
VDNAGQQSRPKTAGFIDLCDKWHIVGWAVVDDQPTPVRIILNKGTPVIVTPYVPRADCHAAGYPPICGWNHYFRETLTEQDVVEVEFPDGVPFPGSPVRLAGRST